MRALIKRMKSKTFWLGIGVFFMGLMEQISGLVSEVVSPENRGLALGFLGLSIWALREVTKKPIDKK